MKEYKIKQTRNHGMSDRPDTVNIIAGTLDYLKEYFSYTLECGVSWNNKINANPKTIKTFVNAINKSYNEVQGGYSYTTVEEVK